ncbi:MAG: DUF4230 domain-containing protein [Spirochaetales bacterium]|nr:DUF4230 domain-containing protein [Spirochaetales bacterium]
MKKKILKTLNNSNNKGSQQKIIIKTPPPRRKIIIIIAIVAAAIVLATGGIILPQFGIGLSKTTKLTASEISLIGMEKLAVLDTIEMTYKTVFPFDFMPTEWEFRRLLEKDSYTEDELFYLMTNFICQELKINPYNTEEFIVITTILTAGYKSEDENGINFQEAIMIDEEKSKITIALPSATVTKVQTEDFSTYSENYPQFKATPQKWKEIIEHIKPKIIEMAVEDGILTKAEENASTKIKIILQATKWNNIEIINSWEN